jgi:hypothetical protein
MARFVFGRQPETPDELRDRCARQAWQLDEMHAMIVEMSHTLRDANVAIDRLVAENDQLWEWIADDIDHETTNHERPR